MQRIIPAAPPGPDVRRVSAVKILYLFPLAVLTAFFIVPVLSIFRHTGAGAVLRALEAPYYRSIIGFTFSQAALSTAAALLAGIPGAWMMSHLDFRGKKFINSLTTVPFVLPSVLVVLGFVLCFGNRGIINSLLMNLLNTDDPPLRVLYSFRAIILAHTFYNFPVGLRLISSAWRSLGRSRIEAAQILGAGRLRIFLTISLPALMPAIIAAGSLIFIFCFMSFAVILVLGGGPAYSTIEVEIYRLARISIDIEAAASLALIGAVLTSTLTYIYIKLQKRASAAENGGTGSAAPAPLVPLSPRNLGRTAKLLTALYLTAAAVFIIGPLAAVAVRAFQSRAGWSGDIVFSLKAFRSLIDSETSLKAVGSSLVFALSTVAIALPAGTIAAYASARRKLKAPELSETLFMLPMGVSSVVLGLGYYSLSPLMGAGSHVGGSAVLIVFAHSVIALPFVVRTMTTGIRRVGTSLLEASATLGAAPLRTFLKIELPLLKGSLISAAAFAFCISAGEINAALILSDGGAVTIPIAIYRLISSYNFFGACAMGSILMLLCGTAFYIIEKFGGDDIF